MPKDPFDTDDFKRWAADMRRRLIPKMRESASIMMIAPDFEQEFDVSFALQVGATIMLEKPLILVVFPGRTYPPKLKAIADKIIIIDPLATDTDTQEQIRRAVVDLGKQ